MGGRPAKSCGFAMNLTILTWISWYHGNTQNPNGKVTSLTVFFLNILFKDIFTFPKTKVMGIDLCTLLVADFTVSSLGSSSLECTKKRDLHFLFSCPIK